ncbi:S41 family peptidase [uncultured Desulfovibrio sp.]|uniref:S41 family peptidase n=2 Tax=uncultured Desulfovibrio sp. TaxID=167968 RepID=UPI0026315118|nr:S41 family peptidase [uncultured Desulfovibrio sp.]
MRTLSVLCSALLGLALLGGGSPVLAAAASAPDAKYEDLRRFSQVLDLVERNYVKDVSRADLINGALKGMLSALDPHSTFMTPEEYKEMHENTAGEFFGVGIEMTLENGQVTVLTPIDDTPAFRAGVQPGDLILSINGQPTQELSLSEVASRIRGPKGTEVELTLLRTNSKTPHTVRIVRDAIPLVSVKSRKLEDGYYWVRLSRFAEPTSEELRKALAQAVKDSKKDGLRGIVLDLRNNPGGLLDQAVEVSDMFLSSGDIVSIKGRDNAMQRVYTARQQPDDMADVPLVVLINAGSASASEIVAGALRDHKRALIVGERSFGKGSVQNLIPLMDKSGLKLTVALYYTPNGSSIQAEGIVPDVDVPFEAPREQDKETERFLVREKDLNRHLENSKQSGQGKDKAANEGREQLERDNQLRMALNLVKSLPRMRNIK